MPPSSSSSAWMPFQCPACFGLLRVTRESVNAQGRCPSCDACLLIPSLGEIKEVLQREGQSEPQAQAVEERFEPEKVPVYAKAELVEPVEKGEDEFSSRKKKKRFIGQGAEGVDWEEGQEELEKEGIPWLLLGSVTLCLVLAFGVGVHYLRNSSFSGNSGREIDLFEDAEITGGFTPKLEGADDAELVKIAKRIDEVDVSLLRASFEGFLTAQTISERAKFCRHSERVLPLMEKFYSGRAYEAEGFRKLEESKISYGGSFVSCYVQTRDFTWAPIVAEKQGDSFVVDWEAWVGYNEMPLGEMLVKKPQEPVLVRAIIRSQNYYNYGFSDDKKWASFRLSFHNEDRRFWAYVERGSEFFDVLSSACRNDAEFPGVFSIKFPENARENDQVILVEMVSSGWVSDIEK